MLRVRMRRSASCRARNVVIATCALVLYAVPARAQHWAPGERTLITEFDQVRAVATDMRHVYGATPNGLIVYDQFAREWRRPSTVLDGFPIGNVPTALAYDDFAGELWMGTQAGVVWRYSPGFERWEQGVIVPGPVRAIGFSRGDAFIQAGGQWFVARGGAFSAERSAPAAVPAEVRARASGEAWGNDPFLRTVLGSLPPDAAGNRWRALAIAPGERRGTYWIGSDGGGLLAYDARTNQADWLPFGLSSHGATLIARAAGMLWFGGDARAFRPGVAVADTQLTHWQRFDARTNGGPDGVLHDVLDAHGFVWLAAEGGVYALHTRDLTRPPQRADWLEVGTLDGLPSTDVFALARAPGGVWVGTARGIVHVDTAGIASAVILAGVAVYDLVLHDGAVWAATARGLLQLDGGAARLPNDMPPSLSGEVRSVAATSAGLFALTADALHQRTTDGTWRTYREPGLAGIGTLRRVAAADGAVWIAAEGGAARWEADSG
ncbi:MAG: hypothetical protein ACREKM_05080, partial [Longimicrobiales bacterium]